MQESLYKQKADTVVYITGCGCKSLYRKLMQESLYEAAGAGVSTDSGCRSLHINDSRCSSHYIRQLVQESLQTADASVSISGSGCMNL